MPAIQLTPAQRKDKRGQAHHLNPVVLIGADGCTAAVRAEVDAALKAHGLIKIRVFSDDRATREQLLLQLAEELDAAPVQHIGKLLVLWRPMPPKYKTAEPDDARMAAPRVVKILKFSKSGTHRPQIKKITVFGNQRVTDGGLIKRARPKPSSVKKKAVD